jgi:hypothetical protein
MKTRPINTPWAVVLILVAIFFDVLSFVPFIAEASAVMGQFTLACLFYFAGINIFKDRPAILYAVATLIELIPYVGLLPMFVVETLLIIAISRRKRLDLGQ